MENLFSWIGRDDGPSPEHRRWHNTIITSPIVDHMHKSLAILGFASDEGVRRNQGRVGAAAGPDAIRAALSSLAITDEVIRMDLGTITCFDTNLELAQHQLSNGVATAFDDGASAVVVLGGGHETSFATHRGLRQYFTDHTIAIINLDAHFDLRFAPTPTSGTPFRQIADLWPMDFNYHVYGISVPNNTHVLFTEAQRLGVDYVTDIEIAAAKRSELIEMVETVAAQVDILHLSIDLDVLPAATAPGVSAPAAYGVPLPIIHTLCTAAAQTGKLRLIDVVELNPTFDIDNRTACVAARLVHDISAELSG